MNDNDEELTGHTAGANATYAPSRITGRLTQPPGDWPSEDLTRESDDGDGGNSELHCVVVLRLCRRSSSMGGESRKTKYKR
jgi:hypothetical protein